MLRELHISNLAVISDVRMELDAGLNCFTGATGAGKSLVIGAVEVLLGMRSPAEMLRGGADEGRVSGVFEVKNLQLLARVQEITDVQVTADGGELLITRRMYASGRSSVSLNGNPITLGMLKQVAEHLVDVHGQHDHQYLLKPANQIDVLDQFGGLSALRKSYHETFQKVMEAKRRIEDLSANRALREQQLELYRFQAREIDAAELSPGEYEELRSRASILENLEKLKKDTHSVHAALYEADGSVLERLKMMGGILAELSMLDQNLKSPTGSLRDATIALEEVAFDLSRYLDKLDLDPGELAEVNERLNTLQRVLNKYGDPAETTLAHRQDLAAKIADLERTTDDFTSLSQTLAPLTAELDRWGHELSAKRAGVAKKLGPMIEKELAHLGMEKAKFTVALAPAAGALPGHSSPASASGFDQVEFIVQTNPGQSPQPLRKIASGGELGRIMLALKGILAQSDRISVLVFDEIDANIGGRLGSIIGSKLRRLAAHHQVLCITHLPQIACYADRHLTVHKQVVGNATETKVRAVEGADRLHELAEMIGGQRITDVTRAQAQELLDTAHEEFAARPNVPATEPPAPQATPTCAKVKSNSRPKVKAG
ncbi:MAG TPA: DNA repair protein RecN [Tepidisphaeraceae bacterium]|nr:DNA repair protein RecN [Tepidisphaeraceae bacterium]